MAMHGDAESPGNLTCGTGGQFEHALCRIDGNLLCTSWIRVNQPAYTNTRGELSRLFWACSRWDEVEEVAKVTGTRMRHYTVKAKLFF